MCLSDSALSNFVLIINIYLAVIEDRFFPDIPKAKLLHRQSRLDSPNDLTRASGCCVKDKAQS